MATLCQIREDGSIAGQWEIGGQPLVVGRGETADANIEDESASRRHSIILRDGEHYIIEDLGSQNGTWVDGRRVLAARLYHNARIVVGRTQFVFLDRQLSAVTRGAARAAITRA
jgi:pSer/pThr/pTyr-binding forkhead associated (FHA) protein